MISASAVYPGVVAATRYEIRIDAYPTTCE
jgi:hypothetical protein